MDLETIAWNELSAMPLGERAHLFNRGGAPFHVLFAQQFDRDALDRLGELATRIRRLAKSGAGADYLRSLLRNRRMMLYFSQPSTRTFLSFCAACQLLGMRIGEVRDTAVSSEFKGESNEDSVRTFSSYYDGIVMRSQVGGLAERMAWVLSNSDRPVPIINAGSGKDQHPTQALLDIYTLQRSFEARGGIDGKTVVFVGDLLRGRTVRSLSYLLTNYGDVRQIFVAPARLQIGDDILDMLRTRGVAFSLSDNLREALPEADAVYMTRIQDEWGAVEGAPAGLAAEEFCFTVAHLDLLKPDGVILHPFPRRNEIAVEVDSDPRAVYWRQMRNGMWIRAALIATIFGQSASVNAYVEG